MSDYLKVKNKKHLYRDKESKSIINTDSDGLQKARALQSRLNTREEEVSNLRNEVKELQKLVSSLIEERNGNS
jgi:vacuolar-type H+-ATPase subunit I/STV1